MRRLIRNGCVITVDGSGTVFDRGFVLLDGARIAAVGPMAALPEAAFDVDVDVAGGFVVPGFINLHQHDYMHLLKGLAGGMRLEPWAFRFARPSRDQMTSDDLAAAFRVSMLEVIRTGTTTVFHHPSRALDAPSFIETARLFGLRQMHAVLYQIRTPKLPDHPFGPAEADAHVASVVERLSGADSLNRPALVIECNAHHTAAGQCSDELVRAGHAVARRFGLPIASHMSGGTLSLGMGFTMYKRKTGRSDVEYLESLGVLDDRWLLIHGIHFTPSDIRTVARCGATVVYTPTSESIRGGGIGPWVAMREAGITCALGSDGPAVDCSVDMLEQMKAVCAFQAAAYRSADAFGADAALRMATIWAAKALGLDREIGSIEAGKRADIVVLRRNRPSQRLASRPVDALVMATHSGDVDSVLVDGRVIFDKGGFSAGIDADAIVTDARGRALDIAVRAGFEDRANPTWPEHMKVDGGHPE